MIGLLVLNVRFTCYSYLKLESLGKRLAEIKDAEKMRQIGPKEGTEEVLSGRIHVVQNPSHVVSLPMPADESKDCKISVQQLSKQALRFLHSIPTKFVLLLVFVTYEEDIAGIPDNEISRKDCFPHLSL